jgi:hypothetical protein
MAKANFISHEVYALGEDMRKLTLPQAPTTPPALAKGRANGSVAKPRARCKAPLPTLTPSRGWASSYVQIHFHALGRVTVRHKPVYEQASLKPQTFHPVRPESRFTKITQPRRYTRLWVTGKTL